MMKVETVGDMYFPLMNCRLTWVDLEEGLLSKFVFVVVLYISDVTDEDGYISTYRCPEPNTESTVQVASVSGFTTPECVVQALSDLRYVSCVLELYVP